MQKTETFAKSFKHSQFSQYGTWDYPTFGSLMPTRSWSDVSRAYRYGFNGKEKDFETANDDYDFGARIYDGRLGRWLSVDPEFKQFPDFSDYNFCKNNSIYYIDKDGKKPKPSSTGDFTTFVIPILKVDFGSTSIEVLEQNLKYYSELMKQLARINFKKYYLTVNVTSTPDPNAKSIDASGKVDKPSQNNDASGVVKVSTDLKVLNADADVQAGTTSGMTLNPNTSGNFNLSIRIISRKAVKIEMELMNNKYGTLKKMWLEFRVKHYKNKAKRVGRRVERRVNRNQV